MKIYNSHIYGNQNVQNVNNAKETNAAQRKGTQKAFSVPEPGTLKKTTESVKAAEDLNKVLSLEEKQLFEQLFPAAPAANIRGPVRAYSLQQNNNEHVIQPEKKILGNYLDIKG